MEKQIFVVEGEPRVRKPMVRCGFCVRGKCKFQGCCTWSLRVVAVVSDAGADLVWKQRRQEWEAKGLMQAMWDQCLLWIHEQWGKLDRFGQAEALLDELRYGAGAGLAKLQL